MSQSIVSCPRVVALVGPYLSGKTSLLENILHMTGASRSASNGERVFGDDSPEAKSLGMGVEINTASTHFLNDCYVFLDCPGSIEFAQEARNAIHAADVAVVVVEADPERIIALSPILHELESEGIPHLVFVNKIDRANVHVRDVAAALEEVSALPVVLRHLPIREGDDITGFVDLAANRAYRYQLRRGASLIEMPASLSEQITSERFNLMETIADFHDDLMEELLEEINPSPEEVFQDLADDMRSSRIMPVLMGSATNGFGLRRLMKALRHEMPDFNDTLARLHAEPRDDNTGYVFKTRYQQHMGKMSYVRLLSGQLSEGDMIGGQRLTSMMRLAGKDLARTSIAAPGEIIVLGRMESLHTGDCIGDVGVECAEALKPVYAKALVVDDRRMEARLSEALHKLIDEDPSYALEHRLETGELILWGQGEMHLRAARARLEEKYSVEVEMESPHVPYKETIRKSTTRHTRFKKQTGGHGQFGDVVIEVRPRGPGEGFDFGNTISGGAIPKQYIPSVEAGVKEYLQRGPLGFPVVDVAVTLKDGSYHNVDSSDMAFKTAGRMAMSEAMPDCVPVLLEPIEKVEVMAPANFTARINSLIASRRGQILGFDARPGWPGWDKVEAHIPQSEMEDLIIELRSLTLGSGTFTHDFHHLTELTGGLRDRVLKKVSR